MDKKCTHRFPWSANAGHQAAETVLGTWALAGDGPWGYGPISPKATAATVRAALAAGCRHVDTAGMFGGGQLEEQLGELLADHPQVRVTTRVGVGMRHNHPAADFSPDALLAGCAAAARRLGRPPDTVLLHTPSTGVLKDRIALRALRQAAEAGLCGSFGASVFEPEQARIAMDAGAKVICVPYNPANRQMEAVMAEAARRGVGVQLREVLHNGRLTDIPRDPASFGRHDVRRPWPPLLLERLEVAREHIAEMAGDVGVTATVIGYALGHPAACRVAVGCRSPEQARVAFAASPLDADRRAVLEGVLYGDAYASRPGGPSPSHWQASSMASSSSSEKP